MNGAAARPSRRVLAAAAAAVAVIGAAAALAAPPLVTAATHDVVLQDFAYAPASITVTAGDTVTWTNNDPVDHTVTSSADPQGSTFDFALAPGASVSLTFDTPGTYDYFCRPHPDMQGTVIVMATDPDASPIPDVAVPSPTGGRGVTALGAALLVLAATGAAWTLASRRAEG